MTIKFFSRWASEVLSVQIVRNPFRFRSNHLVAISYFLHFTKKLCKSLEPFYSYWIMNISINYFLQFLNEVPWSSKHIFYSAIFWFNGTTIENCRKYKKLTQKSLKSSTVQKIYCNEIRKIMETQNRETSLIIDNQIFLAVGLWGPLGTDSEKPFQIQI